MRSSPFADLRAAPADPNAILHLMPVPGALIAACEQFGLSWRDATPLHQHSTAVYLLPHEQLVARITIAESGAYDRAQRTLALLRWLIDNGFPATAPAIDHPSTHDDHTITFWTYYPQPEAGRPTAAALGTLLRRLHALPIPPIALPEYQPLTSLSAAVSVSVALANDDKSWLSDRIAELRDRYQRMSSVLGVGLVHGDAYPGNMLWGHHRQPLLGDWEEAAYAPRELDLANTYQGARFGRTTAELDQFAAEYGYDVREADCFSTLCQMRDLHTLGTYVTLADNGSTAALTELQHRIHTLRNNRTDARWASV